MHFDTEGIPCDLSSRLRGRSRALSFILMIQCPETGGGLRLWNATYEGRDAPTAEEVASSSLHVDYEAGDLLVFDSYRLHQIQSFEGLRARLSATLHALESSPGIWETWF